MSVFKIDPVARDMVRDSSFIRIEGEQEIRQGVDTRLQTLAGENPWNLLIGTRWLELVFVRGTPETLILGEFERRILSQPGMLTVDEIDANRTGDSAITVPWSGTASAGTLNEILRVRGETEITAHT